jgi:hypothetical protein
MNKPTITEKYEGDYQPTLDASFLDTIISLFNNVSPLKINNGEGTKQPVSIISSNYTDVLDTSSFDDKKDLISPNPEGTTEYRFIEENPKKAWSETNVSQHPKHYTSNITDEKVDTSKFFNNTQFYHDNTSPNSTTQLPDRCIKNINNEVICDYNNRLQITPPKLINDSENNMVLRSIGQGDGDIFKTVESSNIKGINGDNYQVWNYENEKLINGGKYFGDVVGSSSQNETFMLIGDIKPNYSF